MKFSRAIHETDDMLTLLAEGVTEDGHRFEPHEIAGQLALVFVLERGDDATEGALREALRVVAEDADVDHERALEHAVALSAVPYEWPSGR